jgi:Cu+-exporting ATPase
MAHLSEQHRIRLLMPNQLTDAATQVNDQTTSVTELRISGMTCGNCARHVTDALRSVAGVESAAVDLTDGRAVVHWKNGSFSDVEALRESVRKAGYQAALPSATTELRITGWNLNVVLGSIATGLLMLGEWLFQLGLVRWFQWLALALALPVQLFCGARFYRGAWNQLKVGSSNMDTLVALGSTTAFVYSAWGLFAGWHTHLYFMEAAAIITLISVGHWIESKASARAAGALRALLNLAPPTARKLRLDGTEIEVPVAELRVGDRFLAELDLRLARDALHSGEVELDGVLARRQRRQPVLAVRPAHRRARPGQHVRSRFDRHARQQRAVGGGHFPGDRAGLLGE